MNRPTDRSPQILTEQTFTAVMHVLDVLYKLWPIACGIFVVGAVWWRTRSLFFIVHQLLKWLGLEGKYTNADDQKVADDYLDLNKFNLKTGFHLRSVKAKVKLHDWMREHNLEFAELRRAGGYFNANQLSFDIPGLWRLCLVRGAYVVMGILLLAIGQFVDKDDFALLRINFTGTWFWAGNNEAHSPTFDLPHMLRGKTWHLQQAECRYTDDPKIAIDMWDKDAICNLVLGLNDEFIAESINSQIKTAQILKIGSCVCFFLLGFFAFRLERARELHARLEAALPRREALATGELHPASSFPYNRTNGGNRGT
ncbi:hypothetical protein BK648_26835 [Pseudomonas poae]|uniref:Uncharacterized protein n=1 Tax=Pseudomonas poae TaxID=200451 RepID=A0A423ESM4_9PSED|nr:hypothetical protein BK648_26835 [Pseudomonas poae]